MYYYCLQWWNHLKIVYLEVNHPVSDVGWAFEYLWLSFYLLHIANTSREPFEAVKGLVNYLARSPKNLPVDLKNPIFELAQNRGQIFGVLKGTE